MLVDRVVNRNMKNDITTMIVTNTAVTKIVTTSVSYVNFLATNLTMNAQLYIKNLLSY